VEPLGVSSQVVAVDPYCSSSVAEGPLESSPAVAEPLGSSPAVAEPLGSSPAVVEPLESSPAVVEPLGSSPVVAVAVWAPIPPSGEAQKTKRPSGRGDLEECTALDKMQAPMHESGRTTSTVHVVSLRV